MVYDKDYILARIIVTPDGCWEWQKARDRLGYGQVSRRSSGESLAHRLSYRIFKEANIDWLVIRHLCDNPPCCNPDHLALGTQQDNLLDAIQKGRRHVTQPFKITPVVAISIRVHLEAGLSQREVARLHNISESHLSTIKHHLMENRK